MHRDRERLRAAWADVFRQVDVVLCPVAIVPAFPHLQDGVWHQRMLKVNGVDRRYVEIEAWPALVGAAYLPATSVPVGATPEGLPVGVQVVAPLYHDRLAIRVGELLAEATADLGGGYRVPPVVRST
jgi:amidase